MRRHVILINVTDIVTFSRQFVANLPWTWDCVVKERGCDYILEYDMRFEDDIFEAFHKAHCRFTFDKEDELC